MNTSAPLKRVICSCGIVPLYTGIVTKFFLAASTPLAIAVVTSPAFPNPQPTTPSSLPTTTMAENVNVRPPLVTLVVRLIATNLSFNSMSLEVFTLLFTLAMIFKI